MIPRSAQSLKISCACVMLIHSGTSQCSRGTVSNRTRDLVDALTWRLNRSVNGWSFTKIYQ